MRAPQFIKRMNPPEMIIFGFLSVILIGSIFLAPISDQNGQATSYLDSLFMAVSATCVTGLAVVNTADHWNNLGQVMILIMVEVGGLGFMSFLVLLLNMTGQHRPLNQKCSFVMPTTSPVSMAALTWSRLSSSFP
jgi:trk system potassium uptake protein TrkH